MRALVQRVREASVVVDGSVVERNVVGQIGAGLCVFVGVTQSDTEEIASKLARKLASLRIFNDADGKMNRSVTDNNGEILVVSQFTLYADASRGNRPSFGGSAGSAQAEPLFDLVVSELGSLGLSVATGVFGADMEVAIVNDGPVTLMIEII